MPDEVPSLADLRRKSPRRSAAKLVSKPVTTPSLFDAVPEISTADILAEQARSLNDGRARPSALPPPQFGIPEPANDRVYSVGELVRTLRALVEQNYAHVTVEGEISNWRLAASGHSYFTLKDGAAQLSVVLFRRQNQLLRFRPKDGDAVRLRGQLSVYDARGQLQLIAESMQQTGLGALLAAVQELKVRLRREGLFDNERPLPSFPHCIGVVTSVQGAALRDIVKVCRRRHAAVNLLIYPAAVQGPNCPAEIAAGVRWFSEHPDRTDLVLVARGGGSWEDLHGFDAEIVVRAIAECSIPVITAIGHATDAVLADSAADQCAPTPSAAAELVTAAQHGLEDRLRRMRSRLERSHRYEMLRSAQKLNRLSAESVLNRTQDAIGRRVQHVDDLSLRVESASTNGLRHHGKRLALIEVLLQQSHPALRLSEDNRHLGTIQSRLLSVRVPAFSAVHKRVNHATAQLEALSPLRVLQRGYALVYGSDGRLLRSAVEVDLGTVVTAQLARGKLLATVTAKE